MTEDEFSPLLSGPGVLTVAQVIELPSVRAATPEHLNADHHGEALQRPVRWMHVIDSEDSVALLDGGEFVLTTAAMLEGDAPEPLTARATRFLEDLEAAGAVALAFEVLDGRDATAQALRDAAQGLSIPVFAFAMRARFVSMTQEVHRRIAAHQLIQLETDRRIHDVFTALSLRSASPERVLNEASALLNSRVTWQRLGHNHEGESITSDNLGNPPDGPQLRVQVLAAGEAAGELLLDHHPDPELASQVLERAAQALAVNVLVERSQRELLRQAESALLHELRRPRAIEEQVARQRMHDLQSNRQKAPQVTALNAVAWVPTALKLAPHQDTFELERRSGRLLDSLSAACQHARIAPLMARLDATTVGALLPLRAAALEGHVLEQVLARAITAQQRPHIAVGIGSVKSDLTQASLELTEAQRIAEAAAALEMLSDAGSGQVSNRRFFRSRDVRVRGLLATLQDEPQVTAFARSELSGIINSEQDLDTLEEFLRTSGNKSELARALHLSRPTLYARLERLESRLGFKLEDPESRTSLHVALLIHRAIRPRTMP